MKRLLPLLCLGLMARSAGAAPAPTPTPTSTDVTVTKIWPVAPKGDIRVLVREAMAHAKRGGSGNTDKAMEVGERSAEALPFLESYSHSNDDEVRFAVVMIAENSHSPRALRLLSNVLVRSNEAVDVSNHALAAIARSYNRTELKRWGEMLFASV